MKIKSTKLRQHRPQTVLSAYIDGKSRHIEVLKLKAVDRLERAQQDSQGELLVTLDGQRHSQTLDLAIFAGLGLAPTALATYAGSAVNGVAGALIGGALGLGAFALPACFFLRRTFEAPQWTPETRWTPNTSPKPSPVKTPGAQRLRSLVDENQARAPGSRHILFLSGHGDRTEVADISMGDLAEAMKGTKLDVTILDACLQGQLEVLTKLAPWAGLVLASPHKIKARGFDLETMLKRETLLRESNLAMVKDMAAVANSTTPSLAIVDTEKLEKSLLPSLGKLGSALCSSLKEPSVRKTIEKALKSSKSTDGIISRRVDLGGFLEELGKRNISPELTRAAQESFSEAVPFQENDHSISFHLTAGRTDQTLPQGWRDFLSELDHSFKPIF
jgi:cysteine peptidase C11 family protein